MASTSKSKATSTTKVSKKADTAKAVAKSAAPKAAATAKAAAPKAAVKAAPAAKGKSKSSGKTDVIVTHEMIAAKAYNLWEQNGYAPGMEMQNWLQAKKELGADA